MGHKAQKKTLSLFPPPLKQDGGNLEKKLGQNRVWDLEIASRLQVPDLVTTPTCQTTGRSRGERKLKLGSVWDAWWEDGRRLVRAACLGRWLSCWGSNVLRDTTSDINLKKNYISFHFVQALNFYNLNSSLAETQPLFCNLPSFGLVQKSLYSAAHPLCTLFSSMGQRNAVLFTPEQHRQHLWSKGSCWRDTSVLGSRLKEAVLHCR